MSILKSTNTGNNFRLSKEFLKAHGYTEYTRGNDNQVLEKYSVYFIREDVRIDIMFEASELTEGNFLFSFIDPTSKIPCSFWVSTIGELLRMETLAKDEYINKFIEKQIK